MICRSGSMRERRNEYAKFTAAGRFLQAVFSYSVKTGKIACGLLGANAMNGPKRPGRWLWFWGIGYVAVLVSASCGRSLRPAIGRRRS